MDKLEKLIGEDRANRHDSALDVDAILEGTNKRIRGRRKRRNMIYSSPAVLLVALVFYFAMPNGNGDHLIPGDEWIMAGIESSSQLFIDEVMLEDEGSELDLYDASIEYLTDLEMNSMTEEIDELFTDEDLAAFYSYLKET